MDVANQGLEFSQAIWFVLERNAIECHVIFFLQVGLGTRLVMESFTALKKAQTNRPISP